MAESDSLAQGRAAIADRAWATAYDALSAADAEKPLTADDLERLALAAYLTCCDADSERAWERAHQAHLADGDIERAVRCAFWLGWGLMNRGEVAQMSGWFGRATRALNDAGIGDCAERGLLHSVAAIGALFGGEPEAAAQLFGEVVAYGERFREPDLLSLGRLGSGQALVRLHDTAGGIALLDEAMVTVTTDAVSPQITGLVYCAVIETCRDVYDLRRAKEWTGALTRWCNEQPELVPFRGQCLVHRAEILQLHGSWPDALDAARTACERLGEPPGQAAAGMAHYQLGECYRLRGELDAAASSYKQAGQLGHDPQPGLSLLRLAQGQTDAAVASIRRALDECDDPIVRPRLLEAYAEIMLATKDVTSARDAADELATTAARVDAPLLTAIALHTSGAVLLAENAPKEALAALRRAWTAWQDIGAPYDAARARVLIGLACRELGDEDAVEMELDAARWAFEQLGAVGDLRRVDTLSRRTPEAAPGGLTLREVQVLRLVATGKTNRTIAGDLFLSEKTVARHVANIFTKLDINSRAAATAYAYEHGLV